LLLGTRHDMINKVSVPGIVNERKDRKGQYVPKSYPHDWRFKESLQK